MEINRFPLLLRAAESDCRSHEPRILRRETVAADLRQRRRQADECGGSRLAEGVFADVCNAFFDDDRGDLLFIVVPRCIYIIRIILHRARTGDGQRAGLRGEGPCYVITTGAGCDFHHAHGGEDGCVDLLVGIHPVFVGRGCVIGNGGLDRAFCGHEISARFAEGYGDIAFAVGLRAVQRDEFAVLPQTDLNVGQGGGRGLIAHAEEALQVQRDGFVGLGRDGRPVKVAVMVGIVFFVRHDGSVQTVAFLYGGSFVADAHGKCDVITHEQRVVGRIAPELRNGGAVGRGNGAVAIGAVSLVRGDERFVVCQDTVFVQVLDGDGTIGHYIAVRIGGKHALDTDGQINECILGGGDGRFAFTFRVGHAFVGKGGYGQQAHNEHQHHQPCQKLFLHGFTSKFYNMYRIALRRRKESAGSHRLAVCRLSRAKCTVRRSSDLRIQLFQRRFPPSQAFAQ